MKLLHKQDSNNLLNRQTNKIFKDLKSWRLGMARDVGLPAYYIFSDKELWSIAESDVIAKEDLLFIKGISKEKYDQYGDDLIDIILSAS